LARAERRFEDADAIRDGLERAGVILEDSPDGTRWLRK
jgi:cysteinyl-tRNA synthetase